MPMLMHVAARLFNAPLLVLPEYAQVVASVFADRLGVEPMVAADVADRYRRPNDRMTIHKRSGIAVLPIVGGMVHRGDGPEADSGVQSYTSIQNRLMELVDDASVRGVLLDIDSGGGEAAGLPELSSFIETMKSQGKPVWAIANTVAASAAYWLGVSADKFFAVPGARVGSIGVYVQHVDVSKMMERKGVVSSFIFAGKHKVDGNPFEPLPDSVRATLQEGVNAMWNDFANHVANRRPGYDVEKVQNLEAAMFTAEKAKENGLVDDVLTLGQTISAFNTYLNGPRTEGQSPGAQMSKEALLYGASDLDQARAEGHKIGRSEHAAEIAKTHVARADVVTALGALFPDNARAETFNEALTDGVPVATAQKFAAKVEGPKAAVVDNRTATDQAVDERMRAEAPGVKGDDAVSMTSREKRLAEIGAGMKSFNQSNGWTR